MSGTITLMTFMPFEVRNGFFEQLTPKSQKEILKEIRGIKLLNTGCFLAALKDGVK